MSSVDAFRLDGRVAFVSGGGGAIGSAIACHLAGAGARIVIGELDGDRAEAAAERVRATGVEALAIATDATVEGQAE